MKHHLNFIARKGRVKRHPATWLGTLPTRKASMAVLYPTKILTLLKTGVIVKAHASQLLDWFSQMYESRRSRQLSSSRAKRQACVCNTRQRSNAGGEK